MNEAALLAGIPRTWWSTPYVGARFPGSRSVTENPGLAEGANCQFFAYEVLRLYGVEVPPWRSSELWHDTARTVRVTDAEPLDLALFGATEDAWGAHVGVVVGEGRVLHLGAEAGRPAVWSMADFAARDRYRILIGFKRVSRA